MAPLGAVWKASRAAPRRKAMSDLSLSGYFSSGDPQGPPRAREEEYCKAVTEDLSTPLARWAGECDADDGDDDVSE